LGCARIRSVLVYTVYNRIIYKCGRYNGRRPKITVNITYLLRIKAKEIDR
jgi:hypothetical protein